MGWVLGEIQLLPPFLGNLLNIFLPVCFSVINTRLELLMGQHVAVFALKKHCILENVCQQSPITR